MQSKKQAIPAPEHWRLAKWAKEAWDSISDDKLRLAMQKAMFPNGLKLKDLEDVGYFDEKHPIDACFSDSDSTSDPGTESCSSSSDSDSPSGSDAPSDSDEPSDSDAPPSDGDVQPDNSDHASTTLMVRQLKLYGQRLTEVCGD